ncbi:MAG TPA: aromatic ring-hydroxylating dioxygenase subunit alpha [Acidimicrobiales bacterium]|nr:aromatic ring-hydroxylating dioxygenase subunit alpha [Acidimicrobiales bacterium]
MAKWPKPPEGSWTEHYPELGTDPVSYEDSVSPEFFELEREAIFKRTWLNVGRVEQLPRGGSYFTKELPAARTSLIVVRGQDGKVRAFHNICRHRGNKLVWQDFPNDEVSGTARQFTCKYHAWRYDLDGSLSFVQQEQEFFKLDKSCTGLVAVHCDVWEGFVFVNLAERPEQSLPEFLGPMVTSLEGYPFDKMTERWHYRAEVKANWKLYMDAFQEFYHAPVLHQHQSPPAMAAAAIQAGFEAPHYRIDGPHRLVSTAGIRAWELPENMVKPVERICRAGLFGPWQAFDLGVEKLPAGVNPAGCDPWGLDSFQLWPNFTILIWGQGWYLTYHYWPTSYNSHTFEGTLYFLPAKTPRERIQHEITALSFKEFGLQDANTLEATQSMLESRAVDGFYLNDQEVLCRHLHHEVAKQVEDYTRTKAGV